MSLQVASERPSAAFQFGGLAYEQAYTDAPVLGRLQRLVFSHATRAFGAPALQLVVDSIQSPQEPEDLASVPSFERLGDRIVAEFVGPALTQRTAADFVNFWKHHLQAYRKLWYAFLVAVEESGDEIEALAHASGDPVELIASAARAAGGPSAEELVRVSCLDMCSARLLVDSFNELEPSDPDEDGKRAQRYNVWSLLHTAYSWCVYQVAAGTHEPTEEIVQEVFSGFAGTAHRSLKAARRGAQLRGLDTGINKELALSIWLRPCEAMFDYLAERDPSLLASFLNDTTLSAGLRARAAVAAGKIEPTENAVTLLLAALDAAPTIVQEGCVYALERHLTPPVVDRLRALQEKPTTAAPVRLAIADALALS